MTDTPKLALVGCGASSPMQLFGIRFGIGFGIREGALEIEITAAIDPDPERARAVAESTGAWPFVSLDEALEAGGFDAVEQGTALATERSARTQSWEKVL